MKRIVDLRKTRFFSILLLLLVSFNFIMPSNLLFAHDPVAATDITLKCTVNKDDITLTWNPITHEKGVKGYYVYRATTPGGQTIVPETDFWIAGTRYVDKKITPGTTYYYIVKPVLGDGYTGRPSNEVMVYYPGTGSSITLTAKSDSGNITLEWTDKNAANVLGYYVFRATKSGGHTDLPETDFWITGNKYADSKAVPGTTYYYIVRPVMKDKTLGSPSNEVCITCQRTYGTISMTIGKAMMIVNGIQKEIDPGKATVPVLRNARTMLPIRALIEAMGGTVDYTSGEQKVTVKWNGKTVCVWIGKTVYTVDGVQKTMDVAPYISETGRTMIPMRFVIESLGCSIDWDGSMNTATITYLLNSKTPSAKDTFTKYFRQLPLPADFRGSWDIKSLGRIEFKQLNNTISGTLGNKDRITGTVTGNRLTGTYVKGNKTYYIEIYLLEGNKSIIGFYCTDQGSGKDWKEFTGELSKGR